MKKNRETFKLPLMIMLSLWFSILPAYLYFSTLDGSDLTSPFPCFKNNIDQEDSFHDSKKKQKILGLTFPVKQALLTPLSLAQTLNPLCPYHLPALTLNALILRC